MTRGHFPSLLWNGAPPPTPTPYPHPRPRLQAEPSPRVTLQGRELVVEIEPLAAESAVRLAASIEEELVARLSESAAQRGMQ